MVLLISPAPLQSYANLPLAVRADRHPKRRAFGMLRIIDLPLTALVLHRISLTVVDDERLITRMLMVHHYFGAAFRHPIERRYLLHRIGHRPVRRHRAHNTALHRCTGNKTSSGTGLLWHWRLLSLVFAAHALLY